MTDIAREITACRLCRSARLDTIIDFGMPYISDFLEPGQEGTRAPLHVARCVDCGLVQTRHTIDRELLWGGRYWYKSGTNESMVRALAAVAVLAGGLQPGDKVLDIGANDGTLLSFYPEYVRKVAVDPIASFKHELGQRADVVVRDFWPTEVEGGFKRITSIACLYDVDDPHAFVQAIKEALAEGGLWIVQMQDEASILRDTAFDYFCHEHCCLYSLATFSRLCAEHGLRVITYQATDVNGGSLRLVVGHSKQPFDYGYRWADTAGTADDWDRFAAKAEFLRAEGVTLLQNLEVAGKRVIGLAASTKFNTVLQWYGLDRLFIHAIVERAPEKIGKFTPGSWIPIIGEDDTSPDLRADYYLAGAWHFLAGLRGRHPETPFLTLLPEVRDYPALQAGVPRAHVTA